ncbi:hypothetical protein [Asticcacaulis excentricus]|uniref:hypothetical protein n=1 Tax=Asticcacaulis excentricus TaxID=78587 RepID=UPI000F82DC7D|nr:hypothetical protein [Asticcacaulis excentricus]
MSKKDNSELVNQAMAALNEDVGDDESYAKGVSALFQLANILGDKWLSEFKINPSSKAFLDEVEVLKRKNENIANVLHMKNAINLLNEELNSSVLMPDRLNRTNKIIYQAFFMGMTFGYLNPAFVLEHNFIQKGRENKAIRQRVQAETTAKTTAWHAPAKDAYHEVKANRPELTSSVQIRDAIDASYKIPGMTPGALYDLVLKWEKE